MQLRLEALQETRKLHIYFIIIINPAKQDLGFVFGVFAFPVRVMVARHSKCPSVRLSVCLSVCLSRYLLLGLLMDFDETSVTCQFGVCECNGLYSFLYPNFWGVLKRGEFTPQILRN